MDWKEEAIKLINEGYTREQARKALNIEMSDEAFRKAIYRYTKDKPDTNEPMDLLKELQKETDIKTLSSKLNLSERVIKAHIEDLQEQGFNIAENNGRIKLSKDVVNMENYHEEDWQGNKVIRFGVVSDTHLCNKYQQLTFLNYLYDLFEREGLKTIYHAGDLSDGFYKNRPSHIYELIPGMAGADAQAEYIISKYPRRKGIITKYITGNHDDTHIMNGGVNIGKIITRQREDMIYLGLNNAKINITPECVLELNHPGDGAAYALSYTIQKLIDSMMGGDKPNILINGHHHKSMYLFYRNIHAFEAGTTEAQTSFMKGKRIAANMGGWIIETHVDNKGTIQRCKGEFIPLYKSLEGDY